MGSDGRRIGRDNKGWLDTTKIHEAAEDWKCNSRPGLSHRIQMPAGHAKRVYSALLFTGQECAKLRIPWENVQLEKQKSICEANFAWIFACYWNGVNSNVTCRLSQSIQIFLQFLKTVDKLVY